VRVQLRRDGVLVGVDDRREEEPQLQDDEDEVLHVAHVDVIADMRIATAAVKKYSARNAMGSKPEVGVVRRVLDDEQVQTEDAELDEEVERRGAHVGEREDLAGERDLLHESGPHDDDAGRGTERRVEHVPHDHAREEIDDEVGDAVLEELREDQPVDGEVSDGVSIDQTMPSAEFLYLMRMSDLIRLIRSSRRFQRFRSRVARLSRALTTRKASSSNERRATRVVEPSLTRRLGERPNVQ
jgi:hypothetical protein